LASAAAESWSLASSDNDSDEDDEENDAADNGPPLCVDEEELRAPCAAPPMPVACMAAGIVPAQPMSKPSSQGKKAKKAKKSKKKNLETASASVSGAGASSVTSSDPVQRLALLQEFDGAFPMTDELAVAVGRTFAELSAAAAAAVAAASPGVALDATCFSSAAAIVYLRTVLAARRDEWELVAAKTLKWLQSKAGSEADGLIAAAEAFFAASE
jgi:hypothetical protein